MTFFAKMSDSVETFKISNGDVKIVLDKQNYLKLNRVVKFKRTYILKIATKKFMNLCWKYNLKNSLRSGNFKTFCV